MDAKDTDKEISLDYCESSDEMDEKKIGDVSRTISRMAYWADLLLSKQDEAVELLKDDKWSLVIYNNLRSMAIDFQYMKEKIYDMMYQTMNHIAIINGSSEILREKYGDEVRKILPADMIEIVKKSDIPPKDKLN